MSGKTGFRPRLRYRDGKRYRPGTDEVARCDVHTQMSGGIEHRPDSEYKGILSMVVSFSITRPVIGQIAGCNAPYSSVLDNVSPLPIFL
jgi:hypothetical protein